MTKTIAIEGAGRSDDPRWHPRWLLAAPHRLAFCAGALLFAASGLWWAAVLLARAHGEAWPWAVPPPVAHGLLFAFGFVPMFFAGFLFTAGPKWLGRPAVAARELRLGVGAFVAGWALFGIGVHAHAALAAAGAALAAGGFANLALRFARLVAASTVRDRVHAQLVLAGCAIGSALLGVAAIALAAGEIGIVRAATAAALWGCVALVFVSVVHRMVPFFTASALPLLDAWRPTWLLWTLVGAVLVEAPLAAADTLGWALPAPLLALRAGAEGTLAALLLWLALRWGLVQSLAIRLLAMLHLGFVWLGLAFALAAVSHALQVFSDGAQSLGLAPLHALAAGFFGSTLIAMVTRVSAGHGGRPLAADDIAWRLFWLLQVAAVARVGAALWPAASAVLVPLAALVWAATVGAWALRYARWYLSPRADGRSG